MLNVVVEPKGGSALELAVTRQRAAGLLGAMVEGDAKQFIRIDTLVRAAEESDHSDVRESKAGGTVHQQELDIAATPFAKLMETDTRDMDQLLCSIVLSTWTATHVGLEPSSSQAAGDAMVEPMAFPSLHDSLTFSYCYKRRFPFFARLLVKLLQDYGDHGPPFDALEGLATLSLFAHTEFGLETGDISADRRKEFEAIPMEPVAMFENEASFAQIFLPQLDSEIGIAVGHAKGTTSRATDDDEHTQRRTMLLLRVVQSMYTWLEILVKNGNIAEEFIFQVPRGRAIRVSKALYLLLHRHIVSLGITPPAPMTDLYVR